MNANILCVIGLVFDISGGYFIYKFGLPNTNLGGGSFYVSDSFDAKKHRINQKYYGAMSRMGIGLIFLGFLMQMAYYLIPMLLP